MNLQGRGETARRQTLQPQLRSSGETPHFIPEVQWDGGVIAGFCFEMMTLLSAVLEATALAATSAVSS